MADPVKSPSSGGRATLRQDFTSSVINSTGANSSPRMKKVVGSLIQHLHDFVRENDVTVPEFMAGLELLSEAGRWSTDQRNEMLLLADILGLETLVDDITSNTLKAASAATPSTSTESTFPTVTAILGPFYRSNAPLLPMGASIVQGFPDGDTTLAHGLVLNHTTGAPIEGAELDIWETAPNGLYEQQDEAQADFNLRGRFRTGADGVFRFYCLRPTSYPIPSDGPGGRVLQLLDRHPMRPAHIHFIVTAPSYKPIVTQIFDRRDPHIVDDAVFAVKDSLVADFVPRQGDPAAKFELKFNFHLEQGSEAEPVCNGT